MKDYLIFIAIFIVLMLSLPLIIVLSGKSVNNHVPTYATVWKAESNSTQSENDIIFDIYDPVSKQKEKIKGYDFICGIVAGEMPCEYNKEALQAQAVAAFSYCLYNKKYGKDDVITIGEEVAFKTPEEAKKLWRNDYESNRQKITEAVSEVYGKALFYNGDIINAYFFSTSSGKTETCKNVFGTDLPYLISVDCPEDKEEKDYKSSKTMSLDEFKKTVKASLDGADFKPSPENYIKDIKRSDAGGIIEVTVCGKKISGPDFRKMFSLRSSNIEVSYNNKKFTFSVKGYGHGVGMSQSEAQHLALNGKNYKEILSYFYHGTDLVDYFDPPKASSTAV